MPRWPHPRRTLPALLRLLFIFNARSAELWLAFSRFTQAHQAERPGQSVFWYARVDPRNVGPGGEFYPRYIMVDYARGSGGYFTTLPPEAAGAEIVTFMEPERTPNTLRRRLATLYDRAIREDGADLAEARDFTLPVVARMDDRDFHEAWSAEFAGRAGACLSRNDPAAALREMERELQAEHAQFALPGEIANSLRLLSLIAASCLDGPAAGYARAIVEQAYFRRPGDLARRVAFDLVRIDGGTAAIEAAARALHDIADREFRAVREADTHPKFMDAHLASAATYRAAMDGYGLLVKYAQEAAVSLPDSRRPIDPVPDLEVNRIRRDFCDERQARCGTALRSDYDTWTDIKNLREQRRRVTAAYTQGELKGRQVLNELVSSKLLYPGWWAPYLRGEEDTLSFQRTLA